VARLAEDPTTAAIPAILITGFPTGNLLSGNVERIIPKPFGVRDLVRVILELGIRRQVSIAV
jgi:hypothetical protein